ncbi:MAG: type II toxin-antitoxin system prevent-host-death family antitoxin [Acidimicrobiales bacterium]
METLTTFDSFTEARDHLKEVLDAAEEGRPVVVSRSDTRAAVVDADRLRSLIASQLPSHAQLVAEAEGWSAFLPGIPVAADGATYVEALDELVDALQEYAADWNDHLRHAPNHKGNWALVQLVSLSDDDQLKEWLVSAAA